MERVYDLTQICVNSVAAARGTDFLTTNIWISSIKWAFHNSHQARPLCDIIGIEWRSLVKTAKHYPAKVGGIQSLLAQSQDWNVDLGFEWCFQTQCPVQSQPLPADILSPVGQNPLEPPYWSNKLTWRGLTQNFNLESANQDKLQPSTPRLWPSQTIYVTNSGYSVELKPGFTEAFQTWVW